MYDMLACIIPGYLVLLWGKIMFFEDVNINISNISIAIVVFVFSYVIGLLAKGIMEKITNPILRNEPEKIRKAYIASKIIFNKRRLPKNKNKLLKQYYIAYNKAIKGNPNTSVPILEAQIAFLRSLIPLFALYFVTIQCWHNNLHIAINSCFIAMFLICVASGCIILVFNLQIKLHTLVWEDEYYSELNTQSHPNGK